MKALVTGAGGFVGHHLVAHLRASGDDVVAVDRHGDRTMDVADLDQVVETFRDVRPDAVYHLAALSHVGESWASPVTAFRVNAEGALNVLTASRDVGASRVLMVGSSEEYGAHPPDTRAITETTPLRPITPYGAAKVASDYLALQAFLGDGLPTIRVRPFNHTGPGQTDRFLVPALARRIAVAERDGAAEVPVGSLDPVRDVSDVRDVVRAYRLLVTGGEPGEVYNVCSGRAVTVRDLAERLLALASRPLKLRVDAELVRAVDVPWLVGDHTRVTTATGWRPEIDLDRTLADVLDDARARL
jgi:GDP-4-dehydro-6-deoxy-D-mannose reductase